MNDGLSSDKVVVVTCDFEADKGVSFTGESLGMIEPDTQGISVACGLSVEWAGVFAGFSVDRGLGSKSKTVSDGLLVGWVYVVGVSDIDGDGHGRVGYGERPALCIADDTPVVGGCIEAGDLYKEEWEVALLPLVSPVCNEFRK